MKPFLLFVSKLIAVSFIVLELFSLSILYHFKGTSFYKQNLVQRWHGKKLDFAILGSSRGLSSIDTDMLEKHWNKDGYNFSVDDTEIGSQRVMLQHLILHRVRIDTLYLAYESTEAFNPQLANNDYRFFPFMSQPFVRDYLQEREGAISFTVAQVFPFLALGYYNVELGAPALFSLFYPNYRYRFGENGDYTYPDLALETLSASESESVLINFDNADLKSIKSICDENHIKLVVLILPAFKTGFSVAGGVSEFDVLDLSKTVTLERDFYDQRHVNRYGRQKLTESFINKQGLQL